MLPIRWCSRRVGHQYSLVHIWHTVWHAASFVWIIHHSGLLSDAQNCRQMHSRCLYHASILWYIFDILHSMYGYIIICPADARCLADVTDDIHSTSSTSSSHTQQSSTDGQHILEGQICQIVSFQYTLVHVWHAASFVWIIHTELLPDSQWINSWWHRRITELPSDAQQMPMTRLSNFIFSVHSGTWLTCCIICMDHTYRTSAWCQLDMM